MFIMLSFALYLPDVYAVTDMPYESLAGSSSYFTHAGFHLRFYTQDSSPLHTLPCAFAWTSAWFRRGPGSVSQLVARGMFLCNPGVCVNAECKVVAVIRPGAQDIILAFVFLAFTVDCLLQACGRECAWQHSPVFDVWRRPGRWLFQSVPATWIAAKATFGPGVICRVHVYVNRKRRPIRMSFFFVMDIIGTLSLIVEFTAIKSELQGCPGCKLVGSTCFLCREATHSNVEHAISQELADSELGGDARHTRFQDWCARWAPHATGKAVAWQRCRMDGQSAYGERAHYDSGHEDLSFQVSDTVSSCAT